MTAATFTPGPSGEPADVSFAYGEPINRLWGIPFVGFIVRAIVLIPHLIILWLFGVVIGLTLWISWIPVLVMGHQAEWIVMVVGGYMRWAVRVVAYLFLLTGPYPPFSMEMGFNPDVRIDGGQPINRLWGIPIFGYIVRVIVLIPHFIVLWVLSIVAAVLACFTWLPVLVLGRQAGPVLDLIGGTARYSVRLYAYLFLITDRYPPFRLGS